MASKDGIPSEAIPVEKLLSRQDQVIQLLTSDQIKFIKRLQEKNPVTLYRFGPQIDETFHALDSEQPWTQADWNAWLKLNPKQEIPENEDEEAKAKLRQKLELEAFLVNRTNLADSLLAVINRESNNMLQGIVVISDGRSTEFSEETYREVQARANRERAKIPIFTVVVGEHREPIEIQITDLQAPAQARPEDTFPVRVEIDGKGLADQNVEVTLEVTKPNGEKMTLPPSLKPGESIRFRPGEPPHAQVGFDIVKPELEGEWKFVARVPKDKREAFVPKEHLSEVAVVNVVKKPLRVLLFASGTSREYRFLRTLLVREVDRGRAQLSIYLQLPPEEIVKIVQDVPPERLLQHFPFDVPFRGRSHVQGRRQVRQPGPIRSGGGLRSGLDATVAGANRSFGELGRHASGRLDFGRRLGLHLRAGPRSEPGQTQKDSRSVPGLPGR